MADILPVTNLRGPAARITQVTSETVPAGEPAVVVMTGADQNRRFHFELPRGLPALDAEADDEVVATFVAAEDTDTGAAVAAKAAVVARETPNYANDATAGNLRGLISKLDRGVADAHLLWITDSLGNEPTEPPRLNANFLAAKYPAVTVIMAYWDEVGETSYKTPITIQTGTGPRTLTIWVAAKSGARPEYLLGSRYQAAIAALNPDAVITLHGHNTGGPPSVHMERNVFLQLTETVAATHPLAGQVLIAENPSLMPGRETWQALKAQYIEMVAGIRGYGFIDAEQAFWDYGDWAADLMGDPTHPNPAGSALIASLVNAAMESAKGAAATRLEPSLVHRPGKNHITNSDFAAWASTNPDGWVPVNATLSKEVTNYETGAQALKITGTATSGAAYAQATLGAEKARELRGELVTLVVRHRVPASNTQIPRFTLQDSVGAVASSDVNVALRDGYAWAFATGRVGAGATQLYVRLFPRVSGTAEVEMSVDRVYLVRGILPLAGS